MTGIRQVAALGLTLMLAATAAHAADEPDELMPGATVLIRYGVVAREEAYLDRKFGETYRGYRQRVRRWL